MFHVGYFKAIITILQTIFKTCSHVLPPEKRKSFQGRLKSPEIPYLVKKSLRKQIQEACKKISRCPYCGDINGVVKKCGMLKISHDKFRNLKKDNTIMQEEIEAYSDAWQINREIEKLVKAPSGLVKILNPLEVLHMLSHIPDEDIQYLLPVSTVYLIDINKLSIWRILYLQYLILSNRYLIDIFTRCCKDVAKISRRYLIDIL